MSENEIPTKFVFSVGRVGGARGQDDIELVGASKAEACQEHIARLIG
jgi:hypothetical protein